jgi:hypothetical protein
MATTFLCPNGDQSDDPEFCSVCGARIDATSAPAPAPVTGVERCPTCGIERKPDARFCETCRYDFKSPAGPPLPMGQGPAEGSSSPTTDPSPPTPLPLRGEPPTTTAVTYWEAVVTVDPALDVEPDPSIPCPTDAPERTFPLDLPENLVGRRSASRGVFPQIALDDPGASHRHLMIYRAPDGASLRVSDLGSTNGTFLNGSAYRLEPGVKTSVADGDRVELGRWTRISFHQHTP